MEEEILRALDRPRHVVFVLLALLCDAEFFRLQALKPGVTLPVVGELLMEGLPERVLIFDPPRGVSARERSAVCQCEFHSRAPCQLHVRLELVLQGFHKAVMLEGGADLLVAKKRETVSSGTPASSYSTAAVSRNIWKWPARTPAICVGRRSRRRARHVKTGANILGHSPQTFMRYVRANDDTARGAIEKMAQGLPPAGQPLTLPAAVSALRVVPGGKSSA